MPEIKAAYSRAELAKIMGVSRQAIDKRAAKEGWPALLGQGGGHLYAYEDLPWDVRQVILARHFALDPRYINHPEMPLADREALHEKFLAAREAARAEALARFDVIQACHDYIAEVAGRNKAGRREFARLYSQGKAPGVTDEHYKLVKTLSQATLELWETKYRRGNLAALLPRREPCGRKTRVRREMAVLFHSELAAIPHTRPCDLVRLMMARRPKDEWVNKATVARWLSRWKRQNHELYTLMKNPSDWRGGYQAAQGSLARAPYAGHTLQMDSTPSDIMTADKQRCAIVAALDVYSRRAVVVTAPTSKSEAIALCLRKAIMAWGVPKIILKDNGRDYTSHHIQGICHALGVETPKLKAYTPESKGHVERFFGTMARGLEERLPGYTGHSVSERAALRERETWAKRVMQTPEGDKAVGVPLTMAELQKVIEAWIKDVYERRPHQGFNRDPGRALAGLTPLQAFTQSTPKPETIRDERVLDILLAEVGEKTVQKDGIHHQGARFTCPALVDYVRQKVQIRFDPENAGTLLVSQNNVFIGIARNEALEGQTLADMQEAKAAHNKALREKKRAFEAVGRAMHVPYTLDLTSGRLAPPPDEPPAVVHLPKELNNEAAQMAREAVAARAGGPGPQAGGQGAGAGDSGRAGSAAVIPFIIHAKIEEADPWEEMPQEVMTNAIKVYEWFLKKQKAVGLKKEDADRMIHLWENYEEVRCCHRKPERISETEVAVPAVKL